MGSTPVRGRLGRAALTALTSAMGLAACGSSVQPGLANTPPGSGSAVPADASLAIDEGEADIDEVAIDRVGDEASLPPPEDASPPLDTSSDVSYDGPIDKDVGIPPSIDSSEASPCTPEGALCTNAPCCPGLSLTCNGNGLCGHWGPQ